jgi:hypothetical protein
MNKNVILINKLIKKYIFLLGSGDVCGVEDQFNLPENVRPYPSEKHPNCSAELWKS